MNFISTFDELNKLYEEVDTKEACKEELVEAAEDEVAEDETPVEEAPVEEPVVEDEPRQVICECDKCGALVIIDEADVVVDEETDLVNVETACQFCEETAGYKIVGVVAPYEPIEQVTEAFERFKRPIPWSKLKDTHKLVSTKLKDFKKGDLVISDETAEDDSLAEYVVKAKLDKSGNFVVEVGDGGEILGEPDEEYLKVVKKDAELEELLDVSIPVNVQANNNDVAVGGLTN